MFFKLSIFRFTLEHVLDYHFALDLEANTLVTFRYSEIVYHVV